MFAHKRVLSCLGAAAVAALAVSTLAGCSGSSDGKTEISYLVQNDPQSIAGAKKFISAFEKENPDITVKLDSQPAGTEGDNLMKTKLSTGDMNDVFVYNTGSLFQALDPDKNLTVLTDQPWVKKESADFKASVSTDKGVYGSPIGTSFVGGILYNKKVYQKLGLKVPTTWAEFIANSETIKKKDPTVAPVIQAYGDTWTSQILVLADAGNVLKEDPQWATEYTANKVKYSQEPALEGFEHLEEIHAKGLLNKDFASLTNEQALKMLADGTGAQYPIQTNAVGTIAADTPNELQNVGYFALPAKKAQDTTSTVWEPDGLFIPKTTTGDKLTAAKKFVNFVTNSKEGCAIQNNDGVPGGPFVTTACAVSGNVPSVVKDVESYFTAKKTEPALEFLSPIKGPNLENYCIQVGSGIETAKKGAKDYDQDVVKQAQQLGLKGW